MKVVVTHKSGIREILDDVRMIKTLTTRNEIIIENKQVCQFQFIDDKPKKQKVQHCLDKSTIEKIEILEV